MKKIVFVAMVALSASLGGCVTTGGPGDIVSQVITYAKAICQFEPTAASVLALLNVEAAGALAIANEICGAVNTAQAKRAVRHGGTITVRVHGVAVKGRRI